MCVCLQEVSVPSPLTAILTPNNSEPSNTFPFHSSPASVRVRDHFTRTPVEFRALSWLINDKLLLYLILLLKPRVGPGHPSFPLFIYFLIFSPFYFSPFYFSLSFIGFTYFLLLSIPSLSTRIGPLRFQAGGRMRRPNLGLVCVLFCNLCYLYSLVKMYCGVLFSLV